MNSIRIIVILIFIAATMLPLARIVLGPTPNPKSHENRNLAELPSKPSSAKEIQSYPKAFEDYWADHFGFRAKMVKYYTLIRYHFNVGLRDKVLIGSQGWLYGGDKNTVSAARNSPLLTKEELQHWGEYVHSQYKKSQALGAPYLFVIVPNKSTLYPEYLPRNIKRGKLSRIDQLLSHLSATYPEIDTLDLRPPLFELKKQHQVFHKKDTHWNLIAAHKSYIKIIDWLNLQGANIQPENYSLSDFYLTESADFQKAGIMYYAGLNVMLGIGFEKKYREKQPMVKNYPERCAKTSPLNLGPWDKPGVHPLVRHLNFHANECKASQKNLLIFRDSFTTLIEPFLAEHFEKSVFVYGTPTNNMFSHFSHEAKPDYVVEQIIERFLAKVPRKGYNY